MAHTFKNCLGIFVLAVQVASANSFELNKLFSRLCVLESSCTTPTIYAFYSERSMCVEIKCNSDLEELTASQETSFNIMSKTYKQRKFSSTSFALNHQESGRKLLVDEYCLQIPFLWKLRCPHELKQVIKYFQQRINEAQIQPTQKVPLLIALDYGEANIHDLCHRATINDMEQKITPDEADFLNQYFQILTSQEAPVIFSLYHNMILQIETMKVSMQYWNQAETRLTKIWHGIVNMLKDMGIGEVLHRFFLLQIVVVLSSFTGIGSKFKEWLVMGTGSSLPEQLPSNVTDLLPPLTPKPSAPPESPISTVDVEDEVLPSPPISPCNVNTPDTPSRAQHFILTNSTPRSLDANHVSPKFKPNKTPSSSKNKDKKHELSRTHTHFF